MSKGKIVVTGSSGFVAEHTIPLLLEAGYTVVPFDIKRNKAEDICVFEAIRRAFTPGCKVLHLAAVARFASCDTDPAEAYRTNVGGTATVLAAAVDADVERVVLASTGSAYMPVWQVPITEHHPVCGNSHYGLSKSLGEQMVAFHRTPFVTLRYGHLYGPNKQTGGMIDSFLSRIARGMKPILYGGWQSCDFCYIPDVAQANLLALETPHVNEIFNIGSGREATVERVYQHLIDYTGYDGEAVRSSLRTVDAPRFVFDISKARRLLGYEPAWPLIADGLKDMLERIDG